MMTKIVRHWSLAGGVACILALTCSVASAQTTYRNISTFFQANSYGTLALNVGAFDSIRSRAQRAFQVVSRRGETAIPQQNAYCFVIVHFGGEPPGRRHSYSFNRYVEEDDGRRHVGGFTSSFEIANRVSPEMPSYCFPWRGEERFLLEVTSTDGEWFDQVYRFQVR